MEITQELKEAINQYEVRQYDRALSTFKKYAKQTNGMAMYYLGLMNYYGQEMKPNLKEAFNLFTKAQAERNANAAFMLGTMYQNGDYVSVDLEKAFSYYRAAFHDQHLESGIRIAEIYEKGTIEPVNYQKALETYVECAKKDHPYALYKIGMAYLNGLGVKKSIESAHLWLNKALQQGSTDAMNQFRVIGTKSQSDDRSTQAIFSIGKDLYDQSKFEDSIIYFEIAQIEGVLEALRYLSIIYQNGQGVPISKEKSFHYLYLASEKGDSESIFQIGQKIEAGDGCPSSYTKAEYYYNKAASLGHQQAQRESILIRGEIG